MTNCPLIMAVAVAYTPTNSDGPMGFLLNDRMVGAPAWLQTERYDIDARIDDVDVAAWNNPTARKGMLSIRMQSLLTERCKLVVHRETKDKSTFALMVGKNGPKFKPADSSDAAVIRAKHPNAIAVPGGSGMFGPGHGRGDLELYGASMKTLAMVLSDAAGKPVVDKTGLTGNYDIHIEGMQKGNPSSDADLGNSVFSVVQDQLGLKLESHQDQVEMLVVDHMERPSEN